MKRLIMESNWFVQLLPEGFPIPSSTVITGPGGSGKPLIGNLIVAEWLKQGGSVIFMTLQYPDQTFIKSSITSVSQMSLGNYPGNTAFIEFDVNAEGIQILELNYLKANVLLPEIWNGSIDIALKMLKKEGPGILLFGSALNLLLFSPTFGDEILEEMKNTLRNTEQKSVLFATSTTAKGDQIAELDSAADNLIFTHSDQISHKLYVTIKRMKEVVFSRDEVEAPFSPDMLSNLKQIADQNRKRIIPLVSKF